MNTVVKHEPRLWPELYDVLEGFPLWFGRGAESEITMRVEEFIEDGTCVVRAEVPGVDPMKDIDVAIDDRTISITAERSESRAEGKRSEFRYGRLARRLALPTGAQTDRIEALYDKGVLEIRIPMREPTTNATHVPIKVNG